MSREGTPSSSGSTALHDLIAGATLVDSAGARPPGATHSITRMTAPSVTLRAALTGRYDVERRLGAGGCLERGSDPAGYRPTTTTGESP